MDAIDQKSKDYFTSLLQAKGWTAIKETLDPYCYYDMEATSPTGKVWRFELKQRNIPSTAYGDAIMEQYKLNSFTRDAASFDQAALVTFFTDKWAISYIFQPMYQDTLYAAATTSFTNHTLKQKQMVHYKLDKTYSCGEDKSI